MIYDVQIVNFHHCCPSRALTLKAVNKLKLKAVTGHEARNLSRVSLTHFFFLCSLHLHSAFGASLAYSRSAHCSFSLLLRHKTETDQPVLRLCASCHSESVVVELMNGNLLRYTSGI